MSVVTVGPPSTSGRRRSFALRLPENWLEFDIWRATRTGDLGRELDRKIDQTPQLAEYRAPLLRALRETAAEAERAGAIAAAGMLEPMGDDAGVLLATLGVFQTEGAADPSENTVDAIAAAITATAARPGATTWRTVQIVDIPAGRAVRVRGVESASMGRNTLECVCMQTLIPVPDDGGVLNVVLTSPQVELADVLLDLFDAISVTLSWSPVPADGSAAPTAP